MSWKRSAIAVWALLMMIAGARQAFMRTGVVQVLGVLLALACLVVLIGYGAELWSRRRGVG